MWRNGTTLNEDEREQIARIVRQSRNIWSGFCFLIAAVTFNSLIHYPTEFVLMLVCASALAVGMWLCKIGNDRIRILEEGSFGWTEDTVQIVSFGGRYSRASIRGQRSYYMQQSALRFKKGDRFIGVRFHPDKQDKWYTFYNTFEPLAYKVYERKDVE